MIKSEKLRWAGHWGYKKHNNFALENVKEGECLGATGVDRRII
jgi:hypothetical protein